MLSEFGSASALCQRFCRDVGLPIYAVNRDRIRDSVLIEYGGVFSYFYNFVWSRWAWHELVVCRLSLGLPSLFPCVANESQFKKTHSPSKISGAFVRICHSLAPTVSVLQPVVGEPSFFPLQRNVAVSVLGHAVVYQQVCLSGLQSVCKMWPWLKVHVIILRENGSDLSHGVSAYCTRRLGAECWGTRLFGALLRNFRVLKRSCGCSVLPVRSFQHEWRG